MALLFLAVGLLVGVCPLVLLASSAQAPVERSRVERFALRQRLVVTPRNGGQVIRYLATTRRWRAAGLAVAYVAALAEAAMSGKLELTLFRTVCGWFVGAVIAEWRIGAAPAGQRRVASLTPRRRADYAGPAVRALPALILVVAIASGAADLAIGASPARSLSWTALALLVAAAIGLTERRLLVRAQPPGQPPDLAAADEAIRSRSLRVLSGGAVALGGICASALTVTLATGCPAGTEHTVHAVGSLCGVVAPIGGWLIATSAKGVRRGEPRPARLRRATT